MASKSIDWDEVLVTKDPKKKEVAVSFKAIDGFKPEVISPGSLCVTIASPETFTHITGSAHWVWAKLDSVPDRYVKVRLDFDQGNGIGEPTTPQYVEWFPGDDQLKQVALSAGVADDLLNSSNYRATATVEGSSCPVGQTTVDFQKDVIPPDPDPDPIPDEDTGGGPLPGDNPECGGTDCNLAAVWLADNGYQFHIDGTAGYGEANPAWVWNGETVGSSSGDQEVFEVTGAHGTATGWKFYDPSTADEPWAALDNDTLQYLTDNFCEIPAKLPGFPGPLILTTEPAQNRPVGDPAPSPIALGSLVPGDTLEGYMVLLFKTTTDSASQSCSFTLATATRVIAFDSNGNQLGGTLSTAQLALSVIFKADGTVFQGLTQIGVWNNNPQPGVNFHQVLLRFKCKHNYTTVVADADTPFIGSWQMILNGEVELQWERAREQDTNILLGNWKTPNDVGGQRLSWGGPDGKWGRFDANPHVSGAPTFSANSANGITLKMLSLGKTDDYLRRWKRKDANYVTPAHCTRIP